ncbi:MAG: MarR family transcriptional regulator [Vallitaleaceae bacterium]|nr:MarR family transcriptional regulator [Vallitaleaceae bacterium]
MIVATKLYHRINEKLDKHLKAIEVNRSEFMVLHALASKGKQAIQSIAEKVFITSSTMTYTVDKLEKRGLIQRVPSPEDRRVIYIEMTDAGNTLWDKTIVDHVDDLGEMFAGVDKEELVQTIEMFKKIGRTIEEYDQK